MTPKTLQAAEAEARRFLAKAKELREADPPPREWFSPSRQSGALRRASMDLTRALADLRRP